MVEARVLVAGNSQSLAIQLEDDAELLDLKTGIRDKEPRLQAFDVYWTKVHGGDWFTVDHPDVEPVVKGDAHVCGRLSLTLKRIAAFELIAPRLAEAQTNGVLHFLVIPRTAKPRVLPWDCSKPSTSEPGAKDYKQETEFEKDMLEFFLLVSIIVLVVGNAFSSFLQAVLG